MFKRLKKFLFLFVNKKIAQDSDSNSSFYNNVICKGKEKLDLELFDKNSDSYLFKQRG